MECYAKAAELNHAKSAHNLAVLHLRSTGGGHQQEAFKLLEQAASLGLKEVFLRLLLLLRPFTSHLPGELGSASLPSGPMWLPPRVAEDHSGD